MVGDSKMAQWLPAVDAIGRQEGWLVRTYTKSACPWTDAMVTVQGEPYESCRTWGQDLLGRLTGPDKPAAVITSALRNSAVPEGSESGKEAMVAGYTSYWSALQDAGVGVVALADNPHPGSQVYTCVGDNPSDYSACDFPAEEGSGTTSLRKAADEVPGAEFVDLTDWLCLDDICPAVIGRVLVYRQGSHITAAYAETMAAVMRAELVPAVETSIAAAPPSTRR
jgi:hypothetical protein